MESKKHILLKLFTSTLYMNSVTFGAGFVVVPFLRRRYVEKLGWIDEAELADVVAIAQSSPGSIIANSTIIMGYHVAGIPGALVCLLGTFLPALVIITLISYTYFLIRDNTYVAYFLRGLNAGVAGVILSVVTDMVKDRVLDGRYFSVIVMIASFVAVFFFKINVIAVILTSACIGIAVSHYRRRREGA